MWSEEEPNGFGRRAFFQVQSPDGILHLEKIAFNEGGLFRCRVDFQTAQTRNSLFNLTIIGKVIVYNLFLYILHFNKLNRNN